MYMYTNFRKTLQIKMSYQSYSNILVRLRKTAIFEPDDIGKTFLAAQNIWPTLYFYSGLPF